VVSDPDATAAAAPDPRVAEVLQGLRSGVRQRQAEAVTMGGALGSDGGLSAAMLAVKSSEYLQEPPVPISHRGRLGRVIVLARKAYFHMFLKWFIRPVLLQQNAFNQAAARVLEDLAQSEERQARELRLLAARLVELEARQGALGEVRPEPPHER
jgi:hypothetical protein